MGEGEEKAGRLGKLLRFCALTTPTGAFHNAAFVYLTVGIKSVGEVTGGGKKHDTEDSRNTQENTRERVVSPS